MKLSNVDGRRQDARPGLSGKCPVCGAITIPKCGEKNVWHWAHKGKRKCDHWWENETEWHRDWKNHFLIEYQEVVRWADDGEKHIADVKTDQEWVIEFQHSYLNPEERRSREAFYGNMVWVVDGLRRKNDLKKFVEALRCGIQKCPKPLLVEIQSSDCRLVHEWCASRVPVFFDFGGKIQPAGLWFLVPIGSEDKAFLLLTGEEIFLNGHLKGNFDPQPWVDELRTLVAAEKKSLEQNRLRALKTRHVSHRTRRRTARF